MSQDPRSNAPVVSAQRGGEAPVLNVKLHERLMRTGAIRPSTLESAFAALQRLRTQKQGGEGATTRPERSVPFPDVRRLRR